jgi:hypothetical protein
VRNFDRYHVSGQSNTLMAHQPKQSKSGIDRYSIPLQQSTILPLPLGISRDIPG